LHIPVTLLIIKYLTGYINVKVLVGQWRSGWRLDDLIRIGFQILCLGDDFTLSHDAVFRSFGEDLVEDCVVAGGFSPGFSVCFFEKFGLAAEFIKARVDSMAT
jgi:hypothetical protein